jgi:hypothetical protein
MISSLLRSSSPHFDDLVSDPTELESLLLQEASATSGCPPEILRSLLLFLESPTPHIHVLNAYRGSDRSWIPGLTAYSLQDLKSFLVAADFLMVPGSMVLTHILPGLIQRFLHQDECADLEAFLEVGVNIRLPERCLDLWLLLVRDHKEKASLSTMWLYKDSRNHAPLWISLAFGLHLDRLQLDGFVLREAGGCGNAETFRTVFERLGCPKFAPEALLRMVLVGGNEEILGVVGTTMSELLNSIHPTIVLFELASAPVERPGFIGRLDFGDRVLRAQKKMAAQVLWVAGYLQLLDELWSLWSEGMQSERVANWDLRVYLTIPNMAEVASRPDLPPRVAAWLKNQQTPVE